MDSKHEWIAPEASSSARLSPARQRRRLSLLCSSLLPAPGQPGRRCVTFSPNRNFFSPTKLHTTPFFNDQTHTLHSPHHAQHTQPLISTHKIIPVRNFLTPHTDFSRCAAWLPEPRPLRLPRLPCCAGVLVYFNAHLHTHNRQGPSRKGQPLFLPSWHSCHTPFVGWTTAPRYVLSPSLVLQLTHTHSRHTHRRRLCPRLPAGLACFWGREGHRRGVEGRPPRYVAAFNLSYLHSRTFSHTHRKLWMSSSPP